MEEIGESSLLAQSRLRDPRGAAAVFIGFMGSGKSTAARELAQALGLSSVDSDTEIERRAGASIASLFESEGEQAFRQIEEEVVLKLLADADEDMAIALGGGSVCSPRVQEVLAGQLVVWLQIEAASAWRRALAHEVKRPLASDWARFRALYEQRAPIYARLADVSLPGEVEGIARQAAPALRALREAPSGTRMLWARSAAGSYPVLIGEGLITQGALRGGLSTAWMPDRSLSRPFCVTDANVGPLYAKQLGELAGIFAIEAGEAHKTLASAEAIWGRLLGAQITRADHLIALGGGVVGDLAGFCAATYQRGMPYVQVPTTLVAQVDSAYGGKTGVDLPQAKNYVGAYHQPSAVIVDPCTLSSLPARELAAGWVEVVKTALIAGGELWRLVAADAPVDQRVISLCAQTKISIVAEDERDAGARQALNLGHTIGHAIETATRYERYLHGEAVGLGLLAALRLSGADEVRDQVRELMRARKLPLCLRGTSVTEVMRAMKHDKKRLRGEVPFVLARRPGEVEVGCEVQLSQVQAAIAELCEQASSG
jgi:shikimate kinase / 3-dehydroquinate synthase